MDKIAADQLAILEQEYAAAEEQLEQEREQRGMRITEIRKFRKEVQLHGWSRCPKQYEMYHYVEFLLSELERKDEEFLALQKDRNNIADCADYQTYLRLTEKNRKLREERDSWYRVARRVEEEKQSAQQEIERLNEELLHAKQ